MTGHTITLKMIMVITTMVTNDRTMMLTTAMLTTIRTVMLAAADDSNDNDENLPGSCTVPSCPTGVSTNTINIIAVGLSYHHHGGS